MWIWLHPGKCWRNSHLPVAAPGSGLKHLWPCQNRFWQRGMKRCGSVVRKRRIMRAPRGTPSSYQPGTSCQWSLGVTTLTRADSPASKHFTPQKVMQNSDICCQKAGMCLVAVITLWHSRVSKERIASLYHRKYAQKCFKNIHSDLKKKTKGYKQITREQK